MNCGVSHVELNEVLKRLFVKVGYKYFMFPGRAKSASRVSVLSGLSRREVVKITSLIETNELSVNSNRPLNRATRVLGGWLQDKHYLDKNGKPRLLTIGEGKYNFKELAKQYSGDVSFGSILDELLRIDAVKMVGETKVKLISKGYIPKTDELNKIDIMGMSVRDLLTTIDHNLNHPEQARFQRMVVYGDISPAGMSEFRLISEEKSHELFLELNEWLANKKRIETKLNFTQPGTRTGIGIYYIEEVEKDIDDEDNQKN